MLLPLFSKPQERLFIATFLLRINKLYLTTTTKIPSQFLWHFYFSNVCTLSPRMSNKNVTKRTLVYTVRVLYTYLAIHIKPFSVCQYRTSVGLACHKIQYRVIVLQLVQVISLDSCRIFFCFAYLYPFISNNDDLDRSIKKLRSYTNTYKRSFFTN